MSDHVTVPVYCLTALSDADKAAYQTAIDKSPDNDYLQPDFIPWPESREGTMEDMYRIWRAVGGDESHFHFAFFIDRESLANQSIIIAQPDAYTMLYSEAANDWARENLTAYLDRKSSSAGVTSQSVPQGTYEGFLEPLDKDILGKRGLTYGRVPASSFRSIWCNLDIANMDLFELVGSEGSAVQIVANGVWDMDVFMEKLGRVIEEYKASGGDIV
ncbi:hypothetical protein LTR85_007229 [Meristemomyces frigidus]|nr:hypothetical protein LTR85_007229 [Meristemomyces frigidus]